MSASTPAPGPTEREIAEQMAITATEQMEAGKNGRCIYGEGVFWFPEPGEALVAGHIYSDAGRAEFRMSSCCEYHFDEMFKEPEE